MCGSFRSRGVVTSPWVLLSDDEDGLTGGVAEDLVEAFEFGFAANEDALISHGLPRKRLRKERLPNRECASGMRIVAERPAFGNDRRRGLSTTEGTEDTEREERAAGRPRPAASPVLSVFPVVTSSRSRRRASSGRLGWRSSRRWRRRRRTGRCWRRRRLCPGGSCRT